MGKRPGGREGRGKRNNGKTGVWFVNQNGPYADFRPRTKTVGHAVDAGLSNREITRTGPDIGRRGKNRWKNAEASVLVLFAELQASKKHQQNCT